MIRFIKEKLARLLYFLLFILFLILIFTSDSARAEVRKEGDDLFRSNIEISRAADPPTLDTYKEEFEDLSISTLQSGKVWADKSVFTKEELYGSEISISGRDFSLQDDFLEVFSVLGSSTERLYQSPSPVDYVFVLDLSTSMLKEVDGEARISRMLRTLNQTLSRITESGLKNRIAVVGFAKKTEVLVELASYKSLILRVPSEPRSSSVKIEVEYERQEDPLGEPQTHTIDATSNLSNETNIENGLARGFQVLLSADPKENEPKLILLSDGKSSCITTGPIFEPYDFRSQEFETIPDEMLEDEEETYEECHRASLFRTLLSAAYRKTLVERTYGRSLEITTVGIDLDIEEEVERKILGISLDPKNHFDQEQAKELYDLWERWLSNETIAFHIEIGDYYHSKPIDIEIQKLETIKDLSKEELIKNISYADQHFSIGSKELETLFESLILENEDIISPIDSTAYNSDSGISTMTYCDPIGEGLNVSDSMSLYLFEKWYELSAQAETERSGEKVRKYSFLSYNDLITNPAYRDPVSFYLDQITVEVMTDIDSISYLKVVIPDKALPIVKASVKFSGLLNTDGLRKIDSIESSLGEDFSEPLRLVYTTIVDSQVLDASESQSLDLITVYASQHSENEDSFTSNEGNRKRESTLTFTPSKENDFYFSAGEEIVYKDCETSYPLRQKEPIEPEVTYYIRKTFYTPTGSAEALIGFCDPVSGAVVEEKRSTEVQSEEDHVKLKPGVDRHSLNNSLLRLKDVNITETAHSVYRTETDSRTHSVSVYLGNNGIYQIKKEDSGARLDLLKEQSINGSSFTTRTLSVKGGDRVTYRLILSNTGTTEAEDIIVRDKIPEELNLVKGSINENGTVKKSEVVWEISNLNPDEYVILYFTVITPHKDTTMSWENSALYYQEKRQMNPEYSNKVVLITYPLDLTIEKFQAVNGNFYTRSLVFVQTGDTLTYYLTIYNTGSRDAKNITIFDTVPYGMTLIKESISNNGIIANNSIMWNIPKLRVNEKITVLFRAAISNSSTMDFRNTGYLQYKDNSLFSIASNEVIARNDHDLIPSGIEDSLILNKKQSVNNQEFTVSDLEIVEGDTITYLITLVNTSDREITDLYIEDNIPKSSILLSPTLSSEAIFVEDRVIFPVSRLGPGEKTERTFSVSVSGSPDHMILNTAYLIGDYLVNRIESNTVRAEKISTELSVHKTQSTLLRPPTEEALMISDTETVTYYITINNASDHRTAVDLIVQDIIPNDLIIDTNTISNQGDLKDSIITWKVPVLKPREHHILSFSASVSVDSDLESWNNTAQLILDSQETIYSNTVTINRITKQSYPNSVAFLDETPVSRPNNDTTTLTEPPKTSYRGSRGFWIVMMTFGGVGFLMSRRKIQDKMLNLIRKFL